MRRIQPSTGLVPVDFGELWRYRELLFFFMWRDVKARYRQTFLGPVWAILRPFISMVLFSAIFGGLAGITSGSSIPYPLFVYAGLLGWNYFSSGLTGGSSSILSNAALMSKAYFPRLYAPISAVIAPIVDFFFAVLIVFGLFAYYHRWPSWHLVFLPGFLVLAMLSGLGVGLWLAGAAVRYRDLGFALPFLIQVWMYVTPVIYPVSLVPERYRWLLSLNPVTAVVNGFRWSFFSGPAPSIGSLAGSIGFSLVVGVSGIYWYRRTERTIADMI
jgi:lipopolysaccharide transport system permease protein